jgi:hypothetical protein
LIKDRKYSSTKNLVISSTCEIPSILDDVKQIGLTKIKKKANKRESEKNL